MGKSCANERNESSLSNCRVQPALSKKEGRDDFRTLRLFHHIPEEQSITDDISAPHTLRLLNQAIEPFQAMLLPPDRCTLHNQVKHFLRTTHEHHRSTFFQFVHFEREQIPASYSFLRLTLSLNPLARLYDTHTFQNQHIAICQGISKELILLCRVKRMRIYCVYEQFALW